jgi:hypothetical protein
VAKFRWNIDEFVRIRKSPGMVAHLNDIGQETVSRCNGDLRAAQAARKQPQEDGYGANVTTSGSRARLYVRAYTARAMAHEAVNNAILKNLPIGNKPQAPAPDREVPRELARRSDAVRNLDVQGNRVHRLDTP